MEPMFNIEKEKIPNNRTIIWRQERNVYEYSPSFRTISPICKASSSRYSNRSLEKGNFQQAEATGRAISFLAYTLVGNQRERERMRKREGTCEGPKNREKFRGQLFERAREKLNDVRGH